MVKKSSKENGKNKIELEYPKHIGLRLILDAILFLIILAAISMSMIIISSSTEDSNSYYLNFQESDEYIEGLMQSAMSSTIPKIKYYDSNGATHEYIGQSVEQILLIDLTIRSANVELNLSSLKQGMEHKISSIFESVFEPDQDFVLIAMFNDQSGNGEGNSEIIISNLRSPPELNENTKPKFEKNLEINNLGLDKMENEEIVIKLYLI